MLPAQWHVDGIKELPAGEMIKDLIIGIGIVTTNKQQVAKIHFRFYP